MYLMWYVCVRTWCELLNCWDEQSRGGESGCLGLGNLEVPILELLPI